EDQCPTLGGAVAEPPCSVACPFELRARQLPHAAGFEPFGESEPRVDGVAIAGLCDEAPVGALGRGVVVTKASERGQSEETGSVVRGGGNPRQQERGAA